MAIDVAPYEPRDLNAVRRLVEEPALAPQFEQQTRGGLENLFQHPHVAGVDLGRVDGAPAGLAVLMVWPSTDGPRSMMRVGVIEPERRRGLGTALLGAVVRRLANLPEGERPPELCASAGLPSETAPAFMAAHRFEHARYFWTMERPGVADRPDPKWPDGIEARLFDGSDRMLADWNDSFNRSFAQHFLNVTSTVEDCRAMTSMSHFRPEGLILAYRDGEVVGFCRDALFPDYGELDVLGVVPEARGIGLGRSLVRWGVRFLQDQSAPRIQLLVDGQNEKALSLYRSEGFETIRTRQVWWRPTASLIDSRSRSVAGTTPRPADRT